MTERGWRILSRACRVHVCVHGSMRLFKQSQGMGGKPCRGNGTTLAAWELRASFYSALVLGWSMQLIVSCAAARPSTSPRQAHCCCSTDHRLTKVSIASLVAPHTGRTSISLTRAWCPRVRCRCATGTKPSCPNRSERWVRMPCWDETGCPDGMGLHGGSHLRPCAQLQVASKCGVCNPASTRAGCKQPSPATQPACF